MKKLAMALTLIMVLAAGLAHADGLPAAKAAAAVKDIHILDATQNMVWTDILTQQIKTSSKADLFINPSLECGLYTRTKVTNTQSSYASSKIRVRVLVDGVALPNYPTDGIVYEWRAQTLNSQLVPVLVGTVVTDQWIELILETMSANAFNFIAENVGADVHTVKVQAAIDVSTSGDATAKATIGFGATTIESVRMINTPGDYPVFQ